MGSGSGSHDDVAVISIAIGAGTSGAARSASARNAVSAGGRDL